MTLGEAKVKSTVIVSKIEGDKAYKRRIMDMGITKGTELYIRKVAPLGLSLIHILQRVNREAMADLDGKDIMFKFPPTFASTHTALVLINDSRSISE